MSFWNTICKGIGVSDNLQSLRNALMMVNKFRYGEIHLHRLSHQAYKLAFNSVMLSVKT